MSRIVALIASALLLPTSSQASLTEGDSSMGRPQPAIAALVSIDDVPACMAYSKDASAQVVAETNALAKLPDCASVGIDPQQTALAFKVAERPEASRQAFLSHLAAAGIGCLYGSLAPVYTHKFVNGYGYGDSEQFNYAFGTGVGLLSLKAAAAFITLGHSLALVGGYVVCSSRVNYVLYREKNGNK